MSTRNRRTKHCNPGTARICEKYCPWFVCGLDDRQTHCWANAQNSVHRLYGGH